MRFQWKWIGGAAIAAGAIGASGSPAAAQVEPPFSLEVVPGPTNLQITAIATRPGDPSHLFALTRVGQVGIIENGRTLLPTPLLSLESVVLGGEGGALGLAFDPDYQTNGHLYIAYTTSSTSSSDRYVIARFTAASPSDLTVDPSTRATVMSLQGDIGIHLGGWIGFGPQGLLYISRGEGPAFAQVAQDPTRIQGKILRIDVRADDFPDDPLRNYAIPPGNPFASGAHGAPEVFARGLRNPWRCSIDPPTGMLWIGEVGTAHEEINRISLNDPEPGVAANFGWPCFDGHTQVQSNNLCQSPDDLLDPLVEFNRSGPNPALVSTCLTGGLVYRGCAVPELRGRYLYASCTTGRLCSLDASSPNPASTAIAYTTSVLSTYCFGEDAFGEVYLGTATGIYRILPPAGQFIDCNNNGRADACEIADGSAADADNDGVPDGCAPACPADVNRDGILSVGDLFHFLARWFEAHPQSDFNMDSTVSLEDLFAFLRAYFRGCP